jgi:hypothetical protein
MPSPVTSTTLGLGLALALLVSGCGGNDGSGVAAEDTPASSASQQPSGGGPQGDPDQLQAIRDCLKAAGLETALPSGMPSNLPSGMPTNMPSGMPTNPPSGMPTDMGSGFPGAGAGQFDDPSVRKALKACGIEIPTVPGG